MDWLTQFLNNRPIIQLIDIAIVWYIIYKLLMYVRGTRAINVLKGVAIIIFAKFVSSVLQLQTIDWILDQVISWGVVGTMIVFQPELRKALETLGRNLFRNRPAPNNPSQDLIQDLIVSANYMSKRKIGALISIEGEDRLDEYIQTGISLDSQISSQLLINIFIPNTPLHDGAVIISDYRIAVAAGYLPLSESDQIPKELGTRHRAAIGLSEVSDAMTLVISEETGAISIVKKGEFHRDLSQADLETLLNKYLFEEEDVLRDQGLIQNIRSYLNTNFKQRGDDQ
ncbi:diadenylate cyclase CdaA [Fundicoccus culcitae]|uniref:Diadenylate cyclase n=1 Tax=Fundicoccus culcitae TaxID=2969821 RepID=A0ABY5P2N0_9LACT|nr:diadenylate cyclase CdaA [Fundicoccus culcitae]UUX32987.1 diadenylate cyclase CdaA [Fundicoccus culcitae]